jgi:hypothetical protein
MGLKIIIFACFISLSASSQTINYCNYIKLDVSEYNYDGDKRVGCSPSILSNGNDKFARFLIEHSQRFEYLMFNSMSNSNDKIKVISSYYPDTSKIHLEYCKMIVQENSFINDLINLTPNNLTNWPHTKDTFTVDELLLVASKFFYCDQVNEEDTSVARHICIGINGQNEIKSEKNLILLQSFAFEAIFHYLLKKRSPLFEKNFDDFRRQSSRRNKLHFVDFDSHLISVRNECYEYMINNPDLKIKLLQYHRKNKNNFNFYLKENGS